MFFPVPFSFSLSMLWFWFSPLLNHRILTTNEEVLMGRIIAFDKNNSTTSNVKQIIKQMAAAKAKNLLVMHNIRFADSMIKNITRTSYYAKRVSLDILRREAIQGLYKAASNYGGRKNNRFSTFAGVHVKDAILRAITRQRQDEGFPLKHHEVILLNRAKKLRYKLGLETDEEVAAALKMSVKRYRRIRDQSGQNVKPSPPPPQQ